MSGPDFNLLSLTTIGQRPPKTSIFSAWNEHLPFAMALVEMLKPRSLVELGTHAGVSYTAFCQAVKELGIDCKCFAVDTWDGDPHTGAYEKTTYEMVTVLNEPYRAFSNLLRMTFDQALTQVPDGSVDLLHIDGIHTYEAVSHDYQTWSPKMSSRGVILFHDTTALNAGFGVDRLWREVSAGKPSFNFQHGSGLGVLGYGAEQSDAMLAFFAAANESPDRMRTVFAALGYQWEADAQRTATPAERAREASERMDRIRDELKRNHPFKFSLLGRALRRCKRVAVAAGRAAVD